MRIDFHGRLADEPEVRVGFIGCGSHAFRNLYPVLQFAPVRLVATCDLELDRARAFAAQFGAEASYDDHRTMLERADLDAVLICTGYDPAGRPLYPSLTMDCLEAGRHVWIEKPPAATCADIDRMKDAAARAGRHVMVGLKKMFFPANEKARQLMDLDEFGSPQLVTIRYPQYLPSVDEFNAYIHHGQNNMVRSFLDHLCHPASLLFYLLGMPETLCYQRSGSGAGAAMFTYASGCVASIAFTHGQANNGGMERTMIVAENSRHLTIENNIKVTLHREPPVRYGESPSYYEGGADAGSTTWEPEFSLGQLYNKGLFLLGYYSEINAFARSILDGTSPTRGTLDQAWQVTRLFEAFAQGPGRVIPLNI